MDKKITMLAIVLVVVLVGVGGVLVGRSLVGRGDSNVASLLDEKTRELEEKNRQIQELERQTAQLRKDLDESAKQVVALQDRLDQANRGLSSIQERLKTAGRAPQASREAAASGAPRAAEVGSYETLRDTAVYEEASSASRKVATIPRGTKVNVVGSVGDWLEVRSKHGKPPGYIRRDDARYMGAN